MRTPDIRTCRRLGSLTLAVAIVAGAAASLLQCTQSGDGPPATRSATGPAKGPATRPATPRTNASASAPDTRPSAPINGMQAKLDRLADVVAMHVSNRHGAALWRQKSAVQADISVEFDGKVALEGTMWYEQRTGRTRINLKDGPALIFDGKSVWVSPAAGTAPAPPPGARLHVLTWPSFLVAPLRLHDADAVCTAYRQRPLQGQRRDVIDVQFKNVSADQPNSHYVVYSVPGNDKLTVHGLASVIAHGKTPDEAMASPGCVTFEKLETVEGILFPTSWTIWNWSNDIGSQGGPLGHVTITNVKFVIPPDDAFVKPADAREELPATTPTTQPNQ